MHTDTITACDASLALGEALEKLSALRTFQCGQMHENATEISRTGESEQGNIDYPEWKIKNLGFCSKEIRNSTLGCAHSLSYPIFTTEIGKLSKLGLIDEDCLPMQEISNTITSVYVMDHEKGRLEKLHAVLCEERSGSPEVAETAEMLENLRQEHRALIQQIGKYHRQVLKYLREKLAETAA